MVSSESRSRSQRMTQAAASRVAELEEQADRQRRALRYPGAGLTWLLDWVKQPIAALVLSLSSASGTCLVVASYPFKMMMHPVQGLLDRMQAHLSAGAMRPVISLSTAWPQRAGRGCRGAGA